MWQGSARSARHGAAERTSLDITAIYRKFKAATLLPKSIRVVG
jgi:hypothetical protein